MCVIEGVSLLLSCCCLEEFGGLVHVHIVVLSHAESLCSTSVVLDLERREGIQKEGRETHLVVSEGDGTGSVEEDCLLLTTTESSADLDG